MPIRTSGPSQRRSGVLLHWAPRFNPFGLAVMGLVWLAQCTAPSGSSDALPGKSDALDVPTGPSDMREVATAKPDATDALDRKPDAKDVQVDTLDVTDVPDLAPDQADSTDLLDDQGDAVEVGPTCPVDWEHTPDPRMAPVTEPTYYSRPFFTTCDNGGFFHQFWMDYNEPIAEFDMEEMALWTQCLSGKCRDGACEDDVAYIESQIPSGFPMEAGTIGISSDDCHPCNPNNALFSVCQEANMPESAICDGGMGWCEEDPMPHNGPCGWERRGWSLGVRNLPVTSFLVLATKGWNEVCQDFECSAYVYEPCWFGKALTRAKNTTSITNTPLDRALCDEGSVGHLVYNGENLVVDRATITMGSRTLLGDELPSSPIPPFEPEPLDYFTCSGFATMHTVTGRWFKAAWLFHYDPSTCDKPCWMAASDEALPVQFGMVELPGEPGTSQ